MSGKNNLNPPFNKLTPEEHRKIAKKGGKASVEARRRKKTLKEELEIMLSLVDESTGKTNQELGAAALIKEMLKGNIKAFEVIRDTTGQKPKEQVEVSSPVNETASKIDEYIKNKDE